MSRVIHEQTRWLDLIEDIDALTKLTDSMWQETKHQPQCEYTGLVDLDFDQILQIDPDVVPFHTKSIGKIKQSLHAGMLRNNQIKRYEFENSHKIHNQISEKFDITKTQVHLNVQEPGNVVGIHVDKYRIHMTRGEHDFSKTLTKDLFSGVIFCHDWQLGQVFMTGTESITNWKQGDSYTFPWYMPHGSANAGKHDRYLIQFVGELTQLNKKND